MLNRNNLHKYQVVAVNHIRKHTGAALFLDMGLGKTVSTLTAISDLIYDFEIANVLIVAPKRVAEMTWTDEVNTWAHLHGLNVIVISGDAKKRERLARTPADVHTISRDNLAWLVKMWGGQKTPYEMLVLDELSSFKNKQSARFTAAKIIARSAKRVVGLTGTPSPNGLIDLWAQMYLIDGGHRLGRTLTDFRSNYFRAIGTAGVAFKYVPLRKETEKELADKIADITLSMKAVEYLDMPEKVIITDRVTLSAEEAKQYEDFERKQVLELLDEIGGNIADITAVNAAVLSSKLLQFAGGSVYDEDKNVHLIHNAKLEALDELIEATHGAPVLVSYNFKHERDRILERFPQARALNGIEDVRDWNDGKIEMLVTHPASAGHGLNMQKGGNRLIWFGQSWNLELYQQFNARLYRQGQKNTVYIHHLVTVGTIDEKVIKALTGKAESQDALMSAVKNLLKKYAV